MVLRLTLLLSVSLLVAAPAAAAPDLSQPARPALRRAELSPEFEPRPRYGGLVSHAEAAAEYEALIRELDAMISGLEGLPGVVPSPGPDGAPWPPGGDKGRPAGPPPGEILTPAGQGPAGGGPP